MVMRGIEFLPMSWYSSHLSESGAAGSASASQAGGREFESRLSLFLKLSLEKSL
jgi:hypothetical protein